MSTQDTKFDPNQAWKFNGKTLSFKTPVVMGILNLSPDSFYDGSMRKKQPDLLERAEKMVMAGAKILDLGAVSTRPGSVDPGIDAELRRLLPAVKLIRNTFPEIIISVDTFRSEVALATAELGADMINDVYAGTYDGKMFNTVGLLKLPYVMMHMKGTPADMQKNPEYKNVVSEVKNFFRKSLEAAQASGIKKIILDPGFGFGKSPVHNHQLLKKLSSIHALGFPLLAGLSRKSMVNNILDTKPEEALNGTTVVNTLALVNGANILRVHDVKEAVEVIKLTEFYKSV